MSERQVFIVDEGLVTLTHPQGKSSTKTSENKLPTPPPLGELRPPLGTPKAVAPQSAQNPLIAGRAFRYGRMFPRKRAVRSRDEGLSELGLAMHKDSSKTKSGTIPAGYTYLGQFITHDITFDKTARIGDGELTTDQIRQGRTPSLELNSLYGMGPLSESSRHLYENDRLRFKIGKTSKTHLGNAFFELPNDLPRDNSDPKNLRKALIADTRNDRNLALAQTHLAFLKFHNAVVNHLAKDGLLGTELFDEARKKVIQHYQLIVLKDYLPKVIDPSVLDDVLKNGAKVFTSSEKDLFLPIEFAFAAFRFGHSMVSDQYEWNRVFKSPDKANTGPARLHQLFTFTGLSGDMHGALTLPTSWVIDWTRFYDFSRSKDVANKSKCNRAQKIGTSLSLGMKDVSGFPADIPIEPRSVAVLDLQMGSLLGLPSGQEVANILEKSKVEVKPLLADQIADGPNNEINKILIDHRLHEKTPLWYYILREAEIEKQGMCLGGVGSRIVAETIVQLIKTSKYSILPEEGSEPKLDRISPNQFGMADLLVFTKRDDEDIEHALNPLGF